MPKFLSREEVYRLLQRELPPNVYPDGPASGFYSTADMDSVADVAATGYANMERIYENYWPQTADERITDWEITAFGNPLEAYLTLAQRRDRVVQKIRARKGLTKKDMKDTVLSIIGTTRLVDISEWGCSTGGWQIGVSQLGIETYLNAYRMLDVTGPGICGANPADYGYTEEDWLGMREQAYTYQVNVYGYTLSAAERAAISAALYEAEPARSQHVIVDGLNPADMIDGPYDGTVNLDVGDGSFLELEDGVLLDI